MISTSVAIRAIQQERRRWRRELPTEFTRGFIYGLDFCLRLLQDLHAQDVRLRDHSPFVFKAGRIRQMIRQSIAYLVRSDRARGIALLERVLMTKHKTNKKGFVESRGLLAGRS